MPIAYFELFSGQGIGAAAAISRGWPSYTLDINPEHKATFVMDIAKWTPENSADLMNKHPDHKWIIHASPDCKEYSMAKTTKKRDLKAADLLVKAAINIFKHFWNNLAFGSIENPVGGKHGLATRHIIGKLETQGWLYRRRIDYCRYSDHDIVTKKPTYIWLTRKLSVFQPRVCSRDCDYGQRDIHTGKYKHFHEFSDISQKLRAVVPRKVFDELFDAYLLKAGQKRSVVGSARQSRSSMQPQSSMPSRSSKST